MEYNRYDNNINPSTGAVNIKHKENIISSAAAPAIMRTVHYIPRPSLPAVKRVDKTKKAYAFLLYTPEHIIL